jgi:glutamate synthase (NADPH/NADH) small chain
MGKPTGFLEFGRELPDRRPVPVRLRDWREVYEPFSEDQTRTQGARCMDCGIPFCHEGCPLGNLIPEWNDLVYRGDWSTAIERLHATNNFPEFTGRLCPAPCEGSCVLGINADPVAIERIELEIVERAWEEGWVTPQRPIERSGKRVAIVGSGPAGLAAAQQLVRAGHDVVVFERGEKPGGLLRFGIPEFKMEKAVVDRRIAQLVEEGVVFKTSTSVGMVGGEPSRHEPGHERGAGTASSPDVSVVSAEELARTFDAVVLAGGSTNPRDLGIPGRELSGIHLAMEYLKPANMVQDGSLEVHPIDAQGQHVVIIGGGDTGADCLGTAHRQGAASVTQLEIMPPPPSARADANPWPTWPVIMRTASAHEEGGERLYSITSREFVGNEHGGVRAIAVHDVEVVPGPNGPSFEPVVGSEREIPADLVFLAMGFTGPEVTAVVAELDLELDARGNVKADGSWSTSREGVFVCGDMTRGQSLIVWAIAEGRSAAASVDAYLVGSSELPAPLVPGTVALR